MQFPAVVVVFLIVSEAEATTDCYKANIGLTTVPQDIPASVTTLYLHSNLISSIKQEDFNDKYPDLTKLFLSGNVISTIEDSCFRATNLSSLALNKNRITSVPDLSNVQTTLNRLWLDDNRIHSVQASDFNYLQELIVLDLSGNPIAVLPDLSELNLGEIYVKKLAIGCCSANWLREVANVSKVYAGGTTCLSPPQVKGLKMNSISDNQLQTACVAAISHIKSQGHIIPTPFLYDHDNSSCVLASSSTGNDIWLNVDFTHAWMRVQLDIVFMSDLTVDCNVDMMVSHLYSGDGRCGSYRFCKSVDAEQNVCRFECTCSDSCNMITVRVPVEAIQFSLCEIFA